MVYLETKVINETREKIDLREGSANVFHSRHTLQPKGSHGSSFTIRLESATTYREYWVAVTQGPQRNPQPGSQDRVIFSSDDCADWKVVEIFEEVSGQNKTYNWRGTTRRSPNQAEDSPQVADSSAVPAVPFWRRVFWR
jgi:hypothetical protein